MDQLLFVGRSLPRVDGVPKVTGAAVYSEDVTRPGMLWGKATRSPYPHARIMRVDTTEAWAVPGVRAVLTGADLPPILVGQTLRDQPPLARDVVRFVGEKVAAVAADTVEAAEEAAALITVDYEELPAVFDPMAAMERRAPVLHPELRSYPGLPAGPPDVPNVHVHKIYAHGDVRVGFESADRIFEHTFRTPRFHQAYLEPHACVVEVDDGGRVHVWTSIKTPFPTRARLATILDLPEPDVCLWNGPIGGDFGGKGSLIDEPVAYFLARATGRPVKMLMTSVEEFQAGNPRHAAHFTVKTGVTRAGSLCAREVTIYWDSGAYAGHRPLPDASLPADLRALGPYRIPHARVESFYVYTNNVPGGHMRAPGSPQVTFAVESQIDIIARALGIDPIELRLRNGLEDGDLSPLGAEYAGIRMKETLRRAVEVQRARPADRTPGMLRGVGVACCERNTGAGRAEVRVTAREDGSIGVLTGASDTGNGSYTMLRQLVAECFKLQPELVQIEVGDTAHAPWDDGVGASRVTHVTGNAALRAAADLRGQLEAAAADLLEAPNEVIELTPRGFVSREQPARSVSLAAAAQQLVRQVGQAPEALGEYGSDEPPEHIFATHVAEVDVDPETGRVYVRRLVCAHDIGRVLNPLLATSQVEGGAIQGIGFAISEELRSEQGRILNGNLSDYRVPSIADAPPVLDVTFVEAGPSPGTPFGAKSIAEVTSMPVPAAVANAVADAINVHLPELPLAAERVLEAIKRTE